MRIERMGVILNVERYEACVAFYRDVFSLPVMFEVRENDFGLTCLAFGDGYLMVESGGEARPQGKTLAENATKLRFNVADVEEARRHLATKSIEVAVEHSPWGSVIHLHDPDGNRIGIRDEQGFEQQAVPHA